MNETESSEAITKIHDFLKKHHFSEIRLAAKNGQHQQLEYLIDKHIIPFFPMTNFKPLFNFNIKGMCEEVILAQHLNVIQMLHQKFPQIINWETFIAQSVKHNQFNITKFLIEQGVPITHKVLEEGIMHDCVETFKFLHNSYTKQLPFPHYHQELENELFALNFSIRQNKKNITQYLIQDLKHDVNIVIQNPYSHEETLEWAKTYKNILLMKEDLEDSLDIKEHQPVQNKPKI